MNEIIQRHPDTLTSRQLFVFGLMLVILILYLLRFYSVPPVLKVFMGNEIAADYQSNYLEDTADMKIQSSIGYHFSTGTRLMKSDEKAVKWWQKAADQGDVKAFASLARAYSLGIGVERDYAVANYYLNKAIEKDYSYAYTLKGWCYARGTCQKKSDKKAAFYFIQAAVNSKDGYAHSYLGYYYLHGMAGFDKSLEKTRFHYQKAVDQGLKEAEKQLELLDKS